MAKPLKGLLLVGNVVRHCEGGPYGGLQEFVPRLWAYHTSAYADLLPGPASSSEKMRIQADDLVYYAVATMATRKNPGYGPIDFRPTL